MKFSHMLARKGMGGPHHHSHPFIKRLAIGTDKTTHASHPVLDQAHGISRPEYFFRDIPRQPAAQADNRNSAPAKGRGQRHNRVTLFGRFFFAWVRRQYRLRIFPAKAGVENEELRQ
jgi:hypothetical protein